jgi:hypothetical protein
VPIQELVDLSHIGVPGRPATPREIRAALPRGWVLDDDGATARRDLRLFFRDGWVLAAGLVMFGTAVLALFWSTFPRGGAGLVRFAAVIGLVVLAGGVVAPIITRSLARRVSNSSRDHSS